MPGLVHDFLASSLLDLGGSFERSYHFFLNNIFSVFGAWGPTAFTNEFLMKTSDQ